MISPIDIRRGGKWATLGFMLGVVILIAVYFYESSITNIDFFQFLQQSKVQSLMILLILAIPTISGIFVGSSRLRVSELRGHVNSLVRERDKLMRAHVANKDQSAKLKNLLDKESGYFVDNWDELVTEKDRFREEAEISSTLLTVALEIGRLAGSDGVLEMLATSLKKALFADDCLNFLFDDEKEEFICVQDPKITLSEISCAAVRAIKKEHSPIAINEGQLNTMIPAAVVEKYGVKSGILIPCVKRDVVDAIALVIYTKTVHDFNDRDLHIASGIAGTARIILENADLFEEVLNNHSELQRLLTRLAETQEEERRRFSRDLHDGIIQNLSAILFSLSFLENALDPKEESATKELTQIKNIVEETVTDLRKIIYDLRPTILDSLGLVPTLEKHLDRFSQMTSIETAYVAKVDVRLPGAVETALFRLAQESLNNINKHANATKVSLDLRQADNQVIMAVKDNGAGFSVEKTNRKLSQDSGFGLSGMRERVQSLDGDVEIKSVPGEGTVVNVTIPLEEGA